MANEIMSAKGIAQTEMTAAQRALSIREIVTEIFSYFTGTLQVFLARQVSLNVGLKRPLCSDAGVSTDFGLNKLCVTSGIP